MSGASGYYLSSLFELILHRVPPDGPITGSSRDGDPATMLNEMGG